MVRGQELKTSAIKTGRIDLPTGAYDKVLIISRAAFLESYPGIIIREIIFLTKSKLNTTSIRIFQYENFLECQIT